MNGLRDLLFKIDEVLTLHLHANLCGLWRLDENISWEFPDENERQEPYLPGQIGPAVHLCNKIVIP
jgi:hypothetical protein